MAIVLANKKIPAGLFSAHDDSNMISSFVPSSQHVLFTGSARHVSALNSWITKKTISTSVTVFEKPSGKPRISPALFSFFGQCEGFAKFASHPSSPQNISYVASTSRNF